MSVKIENLYYNCPILLQNLAVSFLGLKLKRERFNKAGNKMLAELMQTKSFRQEEVLEYQDVAFATLARHAIRTTPFYSQWAKKNHIDPENIRSLKDIVHFPVIEKTFIRENNSLFRSNEKHLCKKQFRLFTSGTTGSPLSVWTDPNSRSRHYAFFSRLRQRYGVCHRDRRVTLFGRIIMPASQNKPPFWRHDFFQNNLLMSSYHLNKSNLHYYYQKILAFKPAEIFSYPSSIYLIAKHIVDNGLSPISLKLVMTTAENLLPHQRELISNAFDAPIVNQYGCTEMAFFCSDFSDSSMRVHPEHGVVESRNESGTLSYVGAGEMIATGFINYSMPIVRYAVGDRITLAERNHQGWQILRETSGRTDDIVYAHDGTPVGRLDPIFKGGDGIRYAQIYQSFDGSIELRIIPDTNYTAEHGAMLKQELVKRVGTGLPITITLMNSIPKEANGKFKPVISHFKDVINSD